MGESAGAGGGGGGRERAMEQETGREAGIRQSAQPVQAHPVARAIGAKADTRPSTPAEREELNRQLDRMLTEKDTFDAYRAAQQQNLADIERIRGIGADVFGVSAPPMRPQVQGPAARVTPSLAEMGTLGLDRMIGGSRSAQAQMELQNRAARGDTAAQESLGAAVARGDIAAASAQTPVGRSPKEMMERVGIATIEPRTSDLAQTPVGQTAKEQMERGDISAERVLNIAQTPVGQTAKEVFERTGVAPQQEYYGEDTLEADIFGVPGGAYGREGELYGFPNAQALGEFQTQAMRIPAAVGSFPIPSPILRGIQAISGYDPLEGGRQSLRNIFDAGGKYNPETGRIEAELPRGRLQMNTLGNVTYSGMPDPDYTGPFANLVNPPEEERGGDQQMAAPFVAATVDPCPDGYTLVDGVCQPISPIDTAPDTRFALPTVPLTFEPTTVATPVQQINPFVLSPTGAALGRSI